MTSVSDSAKIAKIHYIYQARPNKERANLFASRKLGRIGYDLDTDHTDKDVLTAKKGNNVHINYSGTNIESPRDILSDVALSVGLQNKNKQFSDRRKKTREVMRKYDKELEGKADYSLSGHSLGSSIALNTMKESKSIRDRVKVVHGFNPGYTPLFHESLKVPKDVKKELDKKVNIHRVSGDIVSAHAKKQTAFGNLFQYKHADKDADLLEKHSLDTFTDVAL